MLETIETPLHRNIPLRFLGPPNVPSDVEEKKGEEKKDRKITREEKRKRPEFLIGI